MIVAVMVVLDEADVIEDNVSHLLGQGVDHVIVEDGGSTDGTVDILDDLASAFPDSVTLTFDTDRAFYQDERMSRLAQRAGDMGAEWVLPVDADEFFVPVVEPSIKRALEAVPPGTAKVFARTFLHRDWDHRELEPKSLPKVVFRWAPGAALHMGNHDVTLSNTTAAWGVLDVREVQYRSLEHLVAKARKGRATLEATDLHPMYAAHTRRLGWMSDAELAEEWEAMQARPVVFDPIPRARFCSSRFRGPWW